MEKKVTESAVKIREILDAAIHSGKITRANYDKITHLATEDSHIDPQEKALLAEFHDMLGDKTIKIVAE